MKNIVCSYYDLEQDQDVERFPNVVEAITTFRAFTWRPIVNNDGEAGIQLIIYHAIDDNLSSIQISNSEAKRWCISISAINRRRFLGPFFAKKTFELLVDKEQSAVEEWIHHFFADSLEVFTKRLDSMIKNESN